MALPSSLIYSQLPIAFHWRDTGHGASGPGRFPPHREASSCTDGRMLVLITHDGRPKPEVFPRQLRRIAPTNIARWTRKGEHIRSTVTGSSTTLISPRMKLEWQRRDSGSQERWQSIDRYDQAAALLRGWQDECDHLGLGENEMADRWYVRATSRGRLLTRRLGV